MALARFDRLVLRLLALALAVASARPARAQGALSFPCAVDPADGTAENGFGAEPGAEPREFCSTLTIPPVCTIDGYYLIGSLAVGLTRTTGAATVPFDIQVRTAPLGGGAPGAVKAGPFPRQAGNVPVFPGSQVYVRSLIDASERFSVGSDAVELTSACTMFSGSGNQGQFLAVDESPGTPATPCHTGINGAPPSDNCLNGNPSLRATRQGLFVAPVGGPASGDQVVPPTGSSGQGVCLAVNDDPTPPGRITFFVQAFDIPAPTAMHVHRGRRGVNGHLVFGFSSLPAPGTNGVTESWEGVSAADLEALEHGDLHINVHTAAFPNGEIRCQLEAANLIFADGFESGDTSAWSLTMPRPEAPISVARPIPPGVRALP